MSAWWIVLLVFGLIAWPFLEHWRALRHQRLVADHAFPPAWRALLDERLPILRRLDAPQRRDHEHKLLAFLKGKRFYGCNGLVVTEEMRVLVAALACLLILRPGTSVYPRLRSVLLYPGSFLVRHQEPDELGLVSDEPVEHLGESWEGDRIVLSWEDVEAALAGDETNVVVHECAHQLDDDSPEAEGAPRLPDYRRWSSVMKPAYERLRQQESPVLDDYGSESPGEFYAVATESFFQRGALLREHHPELYALLRDFYRIETA